MSDLQWGDELRAAALALRDLYELTGASKAVLHFNGVTLTVSQRGIHLAADGRAQKIDEWVEDVGMVVA